MILKGKVSTSKLPKAQELTSHFKKNIMFQQECFVTIVAK
jgi:hypothetical protein